MTVGVVTLPLSKRSQEPSAAREARVNVVALALLLIPLVIGISISAAQDSPWAFIAGTVAGLILMQSPKVAKQWERGVILRLGKYVGLRGPGLFWVVLFMDSVTRWIDQRVI